MKIEIRALAGSFATGISILLSSAISIISVPLILHFWTPSKYGTWVTLLASVPFFSALDIGHQAFLGNKIACNWEKGTKEIRKILSSGVLMALVLGILQIAVATISLLFVWGGDVSFLAFLFIENYAIKSAFLCSVLFSSIVIPVAGILIKIYAPAGLYLNAVWLGIAQVLGNFLFLILGCYLQVNLFIIVVLQSITGIVCAVYLYQDFKKRFPNLCPWWRGGSAKTGLKNFMNSSILSANSFLDQVTGNGMTIIIFAFIAPKEAGIYASLRTISNFGLQGIQIFIAPIYADIAKFFSIREYKKIHQIIFALWASGHFFVTLLFVATAPWVEKFFKNWSHDKLSFNLTLFTCLATAVCLRNWASPLFSLLSCINNLKSQFIISIVRGGLCLSVTAGLIHHFGLTAVGLGILAGEIGAAVSTWVFVSRIFIVNGVKLCPRSGLRGLFLVFLVAFSFAPQAWDFKHAALANLGLVAAVVVVAIFQWINLSADVKERVIRLCPF